MVRIQAGDLSARDELLQSVCGQLEHLASRMLRRFPVVKQHVDTGDVLQSSLMRLLRALQTVQPDSMRAFFGLAAEQMRRELLDLARHYRSGKAAANLVGLPRDGDSDSGSEGKEPADRANDPDELRRWCAFHEEVARLPADEREVVGLIFYHGWEHAEVADLFGVSTKTISRRWQSALLKLRRLMEE
jgi:RNA polymerase sigma-70 factor (ECF subfamily)